MHKRYIILVVLMILSISNLAAQNTGSANFKGIGRIRIADSNPINSTAIQSAYVITGNTITVEAWVFPLTVPKNGNGQRIVIRPYQQDPWQAYSLSIDNFVGDDFPLYSFIISDGTPGNFFIASDTVRTTIGVWTHVAGTYDGTDVKLYINGGLVGSSPYSGNIGAGNTGFYISSLFAAERFNGLIDEVRLWNVARSQAEIQAAMDGTLLGNETGLVGYWPLNEPRMVEGQFPVYIDSTSNNNDLLGQLGAEFVAFPQGSTVELLPIISGAQLVGVVDEFFSFQPVVSGWPIPDVTLLSGPTGMSYNSETGFIEWTPVQGQDGFHNFTFSASNVAGSAESVLGIWIDAVPIEAIEHNNNNTVLTIFNNGVLGRDAAGFQFNGENGLFEADVFVAQSSTQVSGNLFEPEFGTIGSIQSIQSYLSGFDQAFVTVYNDKRAPNPIGIRILQLSHSKSIAPDDDYVVMDYIITNESGSDLTGIYVGMAHDWDVGGFADDMGGFDATRGLGYAYSTDPNDNQNYYGTAVLSGPVSGYMVINGGGTPDDVLFTAATTFPPIPASPADVRNFISTGPYDIPAGGSVRAVFALIGGTDLADLQANADAALSVDLSAASPVILSSIDVPNDEGGKVALNWTASSLDVNVNTLPYYSIWRALPVGVVLSSSAMSVADVTADFSGEAYRTESIAGSDYAWEWVANQPAHRLSIYSYTAETRFDSTSASDGVHYFMVSAHTNDPDLFFDSNISSGYSVDNLAPLRPAGLTGTFVSKTDNVELHWNPNSEDDLQGYLLFRSISPIANLDDAEFIAELSDTAYVDNNPPSVNELYYALVAVDIHENRSKLTSASFIITGVDGDNIGIPESFSLSQNFPNPFNPTTTIQYALPISGGVLLTIFNIRGEEVFQFTDSQNAGYHEIIWDGGRVGSGIYFYRLQASKFVQTRKMVLLK
ncbi:T9SS type A sorting domain-containing protein [Candidatus Marinimicrobia bacterium MT.SAG.4]|nr:T9SS type A sorting domain-containing protein [Candidatus Marinimicrobia bacterium MT.SAG.4]